MLRAFLMPAHRIICSIVTLWGDDLESVMLEQTDIGSWVTETQTAIEDADALNVDQAYRLTLLELGITDDTDAS